VALCRIQLHIQHDFPGDPMQCESAMDRGAIRSDWLNPGCYEFGRRVLIDTEQAFGHDRFVPAGIAEVDARQRYRGLQASVVPPIRVETKTAGAAGDRADRFGKSSMIDREHHPCVYGVEVVVDGPGGDGIAVEQQDTHDNRKIAAEGDRHGCGLWGWYCWILGG
jgi:hypothetical protein